MSVTVVTTCSVEIRRYVFLDFNGFKRLFVLKSYVYLFAQNSSP